MSIISKKLDNILQRKQIEQLTPEWHKIRKNIITATDCSKILNCNPYMSIKELFYKKCGQSKPINNKAVLWGQKYEDIAYTIYSKIYNIKLFKLGLLIHNKHKWLGASPDGISNDCRLIEIKCVYTRDINFVPYYYWIQVQIQLEVCELEECDLFQCKFTECTKDEYESYILNKKEFIDISKIDKYYLLKKKNNITIIGQNKSLEYQTKTSYWKLDDFTITNIKKDKKWFNNSKNKLFKFYNDIKNYSIKQNKQNKQNEQLTITNDLIIRKKRKIGQYINDSKKMKYLQINWTKWISSNSLNNYIIDDPLLDWLNKYSYILYEKYPEYKKYLDTKNNSKFNYQRFLHKLSNNFKNAVIKNLNKRFNKKVINVLYNKEYKSIEKFKKTKKLMKNKVPIITNPLLYNYKKKIYSTPDLLIRSDYINKIYEFVGYETDDELSKGCVYSDNWHYRVINIKYCSLHFNKDNRTIRNKTNVKKYKTDVILANEILENIQKYNPNISYIHCYSSTINKQKHYGYYKLGEVDTLNNDNLILEKTNNAIQWIKKLRKHGHKWNISSRTELYPNMCNRNDYPYHSIKKKIAEELNEITLIWNIGINERNKYHNNEIYSYKDITNHKNPLINKIIETNISRNKTTKKNINIQSYIPKGTTQFYIDFETTNIIDETFNNIKNYNIDNNKTNNYDNYKQLLYMIGYGWEYKGEWKYKTLMVNRLTKKEEKRIVKEFIRIMNRFKNSLLIHWSNAEKVIMNKVLLEHNLEYKFNWIDLLDIYKKQKITIKGCYSYGLKHIAKNLFNLGHINIKWEDDEISALDAILVPINAEKECAKKNITNINQFSYINSIIKYNEIDCRILYELVKIQ